MLGLCTIWVETTRKLLSPVALFGPKMQSSAEEQRAPFCLTLQLNYATVGSHKPLGKHIVSSQKRALLVQQPQPGFRPEPDGCTSAQRPGGQGEAEVALPARRPRGATKCPQALWYGNSRVLAPRNRLPFCPWAEKNDVFLCWCDANPVFSCTVKWPSCPHCYEKGGEAAREEGGSRHCSPRPASRTCPGVQLRHLSTSRPWLTLPAEAVFIPASRRTQFSPVYPKPGSTPPPTSPQRGPRPLPAPPRCSTAPRASSQSDFEEGGAKGEAGRARHFVYGVADAKGVPWRRRGGC